MTSGEGWKEGETFTLGRTREEHNTYLQTNKGLPYTKGGIRPIVALVRQSTVD